MRFIFLGDNRSIVRGMVLLVAFKEEFLHVCWWAGMFLPDTCSLMIALFFARVPEPD